MHNHARLARLIAILLAGLVSPSFALKPAHDSVLPSASKEQVIESFDHGDFNALVKKYTRDGWVDYEGLRGKADKLDRYITSLAEVSLDGMGRNEELALLLNAYNAFTLRLILDYYPVASIMDIPKEKRWEDVRWKIGGHTWSLDQIEHEHIRPQFADPRVHFALVCAATGCPPLRAEAYTGARIEEQLEDQARKVHNSDRWLRLDAETGDLYLTQLYEWYREDFGTDDAAIIAHAARYHAPLKTFLDKGGKVTIHWMKYEWKLNNIPKNSIQESSQ